jgi:hypothetical protein
MSAWRFAEAVGFALVFLIPLPVAIWIGNRQASLLAAFFTAWLVCVVGGVVLGVIWALSIDLPIVVRGGHSPILGSPNLAIDAAIASLLGGGASAGSGILAGGVAVALKLLRPATLNRH